VPKIICGFRDDDGYVKSLEHFKTIEIPREVDVSEQQCTTTYKTLSLQQRAGAPQFLPLM